MNLRFRFSILMGLLLSVLFAGLVATTTTAQAGYATHTALFVRGMHHTTAYARVYFHGTPHGIDRTKVHVWVSNCSALENDDHYPKITGVRLNSYSQSDSHRVVANGDCNFWRSLHNSWTRGSRSADHFTARVRLDNWPDKTMRDERHLCKYGTCDTILGFGESKNNVQATSVQTIPLSLAAYVTKHQTKCNSYDPADIWGGSVRVCTRPYFHRAAGGWISTTGLTTYGEDRFLDGPRPFRDINIYIYSRTHAHAALGNGYNPSRKHFRRLVKGHRAYVKVVIGKIRTQSAPDIYHAVWKFHIAP